MKKTLNVFCGVLCAASVVTAEIEVSDVLKIDGFVDMSATLDDGTFSSLGLDQVELDLHLDLGNGLTSRVDLNEFGGFALEQAYISYDLGTGLAITAGKFLSCTGFETAEPTGLYQYSYHQGMPYGGYQNGVAVSYSSGMFGLYGSVVSSVWNGADKSPDPLGLEAQVSVMPSEAITAKVAFAMEDKGDYSQSLINAWAMYAAGSVKLAGEVNLLGNWGAEDNSGLTGLLMVNYALNEQLAITLRGSAKTDDATDLMTTGVTISPGYALSDSWFVLAEAKAVAVEDGDTTMHFAVESIVTF
jgi:hypothetical protein